MNKRITARDLNKSQRMALRRILRHYWNTENAYAQKPCTSVRFTLRDGHSGGVWVTVDTRRDDCEEFSPRRIICRHHAHMYIGRRGGIAIYDAEFGVGNDERNHVAFMLGAKYKTKSGGSFSRGSVK